MLDDTTTTMNIFFDANFYFQVNTDVQVAVIQGDFESAEQHFELFGRFEGRDPNAFFDTSYYLEQYEDVAEAGVNPLQHFIDFGAAEQRFFNQTVEDAINQGLDEDDLGNVIVGEGDDDGEDDGEDEDVDSDDDGVNDDEDDDDDDDGVDDDEDDDDDDDGIADEDEDDDSDEDDGDDDGEISTGDDGLPNLAVNFDSRTYLRANEDVAAAIVAGQFENAWEHYAKFGQFEGREGVQTDQGAPLDDPFFAFQPEPDQDGVVTRVNGDTLSIFGNAVADVDVTLGEQGNDDEDDDNTIVLGDVLDSGERSRDEFEDEINNVDASDLFGAGVNVRGNSEDNELVGTRQGDTLVGLGGDDTLVGNDGRDVFGGGLGDDTQTGGDGVDEFHFTSNDGTDTITDFVSAASVGEAGDQGDDNDDDNDADDDGITDDLDDDDTDGVDDDDDDNDGIDDDLDTDDDGDGVDDGDDGDDNDGDDDDLDLDDGSTDVRTSDFIAFLDNGNNDGGSVNFANSADGRAGAEGVRIDADDVEREDAIEDLDADNSQTVTIIEGAQTNAEIETEVTGAALNTYVAVFNTDTDKGEIWFDADWSSLAGRTQIASLDNFNSLDDVAELTAADFGVYSTDEGGIDQPGNNGPGVPPVEDGVVNLEAGVDAVGVDGVEETFVYEVDSSSGRVIGLDGEVQISGFTVGEDTLRFDDVDGGTLTDDNFFDFDGVVVTEDDFAPSTLIGFDPEGTTASLIEVLGVADADLSEITFQVA